MPNSMSIDDLIALDPARVRSLPREKQAEAFFKVTQCLSEMAEQSVCPVIIGQVGKSEAEQALSLVYHRIALLLRGLKSLPDPSNFQLVNGAARTMFELLLDLKELSGQPRLAEKFFAFTRVVRFRKATQLKNFLDANPSMDQSKHGRAVAFVSDPQLTQEIEQLCITRWGTARNGGPNWPENWSGLTIADRAHNAGAEYEEIYRSQFFLQSQYVHAGGAGVDGLSREALICSYAIAHRLVQQLFAEATTIIADAFHLFLADSDLRESLRRAANSAGFFAAQAALELP